MINTVDITAAVTTLNTTSTAAGANHLQTLTGTQRTVVQNLQKDIIYRSKKEGIIQQV